MAENSRNGPPDEGQSPESGHRMAAEGMPFPWRWNGGTISTDLDVIWGMSVGIARMEFIILYCLSQHHSERHMRSDTPFQELDQSGSRITAGQGGRAQVLFERCR